MRLPSFVRFLVGFALTTLVTLFLMASALHAVDHIRIDDQRNNLYLPYGIDTVRPDLFLPERPQVRYPIQTIRVGRGDTVTAIYGTACNPPVGDETTVDIALWYYPKGDYCNETPIKFTATDFGTYHPPGGSVPGVVVGGYQNDSAFVVRILAGDTECVHIGLSHGTDRDGDGVWRGRPYFVGSFDYDYDGHEEVFFWVNPIRDTTPRDLVCLDMDAGKIKWSLPVAPEIYRGQLFSLHDSANPRLVFSAFGMGQGARDSLFYSSYGYVAIVDRYGHVLRRRFASKFGEEIKVLELPGDSLFLLTHTLPLNSSESEAEADSSHNTLSLVDRNLRVVKSVLLPDRTSPSWLSDYNNDGKAEIYTLTADGTLRIFDRNLTLLAASDPTTLQRCIASLPNWDSHENVFVFQTVHGAEVYTHDFRKLAAIGPYDYCSPLAYDSRGRMTAFVAGSPGHSIVARIAGRSWAQLVSIFYQDYQIWVLSTLFSLAAGLIVMNLYRSRVSRQRRELAQAHSELAETHEALKQAQATIIAQEKYRQAKNIAGAFAHEIRNSLFPADSALTKMIQLGDLTQADPQRVAGLRESIRTAVSRAVSITEQISSYTRLDTLYAPETVRLGQVIDELKRAHEIMLADAQVTFTVLGSKDTCVVANHRQLATVFSNLLLNSLYALKGRPQPTVTVGWEVCDGTVDIKFADNGIGIPTDKIGRIFETFFSTKPSTGTGLGLATSKKIVEMYQGTISVSSEPDHGTTFLITLNSFSGERN